MFKETTADGARGHGGVTTIPWETITMFVILSACDEGYSGEHPCQRGVLSAFKRRSLVFTALKHGPKHDVGVAVRNTKTKERNTHH